MGQSNGTGKTEVLLVPLRPLRFAAINRARLMVIVCILTVLKINTILGILTYRTGKTEFKANGLTEHFLHQITFSIIVIISISTVINLEDPGSFLLVQPWLTIGEGPATGIGTGTTHGVSDTYRVTNSTEVGITDTNHTDNSICCTIASTYTKGTGILFRYINLQHTGIWLHTWNRLYIYGLKVIQICKAIVAAYHILPVKRLTHLGTKLTDNNLLLGLLKALYLVALQNTFIDLNGNLAMIIYTHIMNLGHNIAIIHINLLDVGQILLKGHTVKTITRL